LLLSSIINTQDAFAGRSHSVVPAQLIGYRDEYEWILRHYERLNSCPTRSEFLTQFPDFPLSEDQVDARYPAMRIREAASVRDLQRRIITAQRFLTEKKVEEAFSEIQGVHLDLSVGRPDNVLVDPGFLDDYESLASGADRVPLPWNTLQGKTNGIGPGELWYFAARQGHGKSSFLIAMAVAAAQQGLRTCIYSLEMRKRLVQVRSHVAAGHLLGMDVDAYAMLHGQFDQRDYKELLDTISTAFPGEIHIHDQTSGRVTPGVIASHAADYDLNIVDYVGLMYTDDGRPAISDYRAMAEISNQLKEISLAKATRVLGAAQINRDGDNSLKRPPKLKSLAQSDHLGNDGDVVITMKRYGRDACALSLEKNRNGDSERMFWTNYLPNIGEFGEITRDEADEIRLQAEFDDD